MRNRTAKPRGRRAVCTYLPCHTTSAEKRFAQGTDRKLFNCVSFEILFTTRRRAIDVFRGGFAPHSGKGGAP